MIPFFRQQGACSEMTNGKLKARPSMRGVLKEFSQNTTAHGISQIHIANNWFWRILWVLACGVGISVVLWQSTVLVLTYLSKPQKTTIDVAYSQVWYIQNLFHHVIEY